MKGACKLKKRFTVETDGRSIFFKQNKEFFNIHFEINLKHIVIILLSLSILTKKYYLPIETTTKAIITNVIPSSPLDNNGFIFCESSKRILSTEEIFKLKNNKSTNFKEILRFSINEIYARHGYKFKKGGKFDVHYSNFEWYLSIKKRNIIYWNEFNAIERENLKELILIEKQYGYR